MAVVSGQNLSLVVGVIMLSAPLLGRRKALLAAMLFSLFYAFLTGLGIATIRALIMSILSLIGKLFGREGEAVKLLNLTAILMLLFDPNLLLSISFQLSFLATFAAISLSPQVLDRLSFVPMLIKGGLAVSLSAQLLTMPIIALNFGQLSLLGIVTNVLVLWTVLPIMLSATVVLLIGLINVQLASFLSIIPQILVSYFIYIVKFFNYIPGSYLKLPDQSLLVWVGYYFLLAAIYLKFKTNETKG